MPRSTSLALVFCVLAAAPARPAEPTRVAPIYSLPDDGSWVEYEWTGVGPKGEEVKGVLRISSVGTKTVAGVTSRWVEVRKDYGKGDEKKREYRKFLVPAKAFADSPTLRDHVDSVIGRKGTGVPYALSPSDRRSFLELGLTGDGAALKEVRAHVPVEVALGKYQAREVRARGKSGDRELEYRGWLSPDVPFGCARFEIFEVPAGAPPKRIFAATAARSGRGAKAEVDETKLR